MKQYKLRLVKNGKTEEVAVNNAKTAIQQAEAGTEYQIVDENGQVVTDVRTDVVGNDLVMFVEGAQQPSLVIQGYTAYHPVDNMPRVAETQVPTFSVEPQKLARVLETPAANLTHSTNTLNTTKLVGFDSASSPATTNHYVSTTTTESVEVLFPQIYSNESKVVEEVPVVKPVSLQLDPIANDNLIDHIESRQEKITVTGSVVNAKNGDLVTLKVGEAVSTGPVTDGRFAIEVDTKSLVVHQTITASIANATDTGNYQVELPELTFDPVTPDNTINIAESTTDVELSGTVSKAPAGSTVKVVIGTQTFTATVNEQGKFSLPVSGDLLSKNTALKATVETPNKVISQEVDYTYQVDVTAPTPTIDLKPITGDNKISGLEAKNEFTTIGGTVTGVEDGQEVTVSCGCATCSGVQWIDMKTTVANGEFKVDFKTVDLLNANFNTVKASVTTKDAAENSATATDSETYTQPVSLTTKASLGGNKFYNLLSNLNGDTNNVNKVFADANPTINYPIAVRFLEANYKLAKAVVELNNGKTYTVDNPHTGFEVPIPVSDLANGNQLKVTVTVIDPATQATKDLSRQITYAYDVTAEIQATIDTINEDKTIAFADLGKETLLKGTLTYDENDIRERDISMTLTAGGVTYTPEVVGKTWSVKVPMSVLANAEGTQTVAIQVTAKDKMDNLATANVEKTYQVDTVVPEVKLSLEPIAGDNAISTDERSGNITIKGKVEGELTAGSKVKLLINGQTTEVEVGADGIFTQDVAASLLVDNPAMTVTASYFATDAAGNSTTVDASQSYSLKNGDIDIKLDSITADDLINVTEKSENIVISGTVSGADARVGQTVTLTIKGTTQTANVESVNGKLVFNATVPATNLIATDKYTIKASISGDNGASASTARTYSVDKEAVAQIDITKVGDFSSNVGEIDPLVRIKGRVEFADGDLYNLGINHKRLHQINVKIGEKTYKAGFHDKQFFIDLPESELAALNEQNVSFEFSLATGNFKNQDIHNSVYGLDSNSDGSYTLWRTAATRVPQLKRVTFESPHLEKVTDTSYKVKYQAEPKVEISGVVTSTENVAVKVGDKIVVKVGEQSYEAQVQTGNQFSVSVDKAVLAKANKVTATLTTTNLAGVEIQVSDIETIITPNTVSSKHVVTQVQPANTINNDHSTEGYNFPYFIEKLGNVRSAVKTVLGGESTPLIYKYHIVTKEELQDPKNIESTNELKVKADTYIAPEDYHKNFADDIRAAYKEIEKYVNIKFVEVDSIAEADTNVYAVKFESFAGSAAYAWAGYNLLWNAGVAYDKSGNNFPFYTALHEIGHTLGMGHSGPTFKDFISKEETLEFTNMSYTYNVNNGLYFNLKTLRMFDMAYLHHQFGVNKEARTGNDVYSFKAYNSYSADGDIYIWDGAGVDTFDASKEEQGVNVDLTPGSWIYVGDTREQNLVVKERKVYNPQTYFNLPTDAVVNAKNGSWWNSLQVGQESTFNEYTKGQAFIGFGTQIENLVGSAHNDNLTGNVADNNIYGGAGNDNIKGGAGNDYLDGGEGTDTLAGGLGNDTYVVENLADTITENADEGDDTILSTVNFDLTTLTNVENITLIGTTANTATGNDLNNTLIANNVGNTLTGGAGDDRLVGGLGADRLVGGEGSDTFVFNTALNGNVDTIDLSAEDKIELSREIFTALSAGSNPLEFISLKEGKLYYDSDKDGVTDPIHFATTSNTISELTQNQFIIV